VNLLRTSLRYFSYAFDALFVFILMAISVVWMVSGPLTLNFYLLPWEGQALVYSLIGLALAGVFVLLMAVRGKMQWLFLSWSVLLLLLIVRYFFFSPYSFTPDTGNYKTALLIVLCAMVAVVGSWMKPASSCR
jgi:phosphoglycerol transferase MdoB-like AlkP superfamily enzyme